MEIEFGNKLEKEDTYFTQTFKEEGQNNNNNK